MYRKWISVALATSLFLAPLSSSVHVLAEEDTQESTTEETPKDVEIVGGLKDTNPDENEVIGMPDATATTLQAEVFKTLVGFGATGQPITTQFYPKDNKPENTKLFNQVVNTQLQLYELLYVTNISSNLEAPVLNDSFEEGQEMTSLPDYITGLKAINKFVKQQIEVIETTDGHDELLLESLKLLVLELDELSAETITKETPISTYDVRAKVLDNANKRISNSISTYFKYLNNGKGSDDITELTKTDLKDTTSSLLTLVKQWENLPHIPNANDQMKPVGIANIVQEWMTALSGMLDQLVTDTGGTTDNGEATKNNTTNPELATSALGRMGSSLFTVKRSDGADNFPNKPLTNTLSWHKYDDLKKSDNKYDPGPAAKDDFLAMFAASAVYTPFVSKIGDKDYLEAYKSLFAKGPQLVKDDDDLVRFEGNSLGPIDILNQVQNLKKPLFFYNDLELLGDSTVYGHSTEDVKGVAQLLTVNDLILTIKNKKELAAVTVHGVMAQDVDSWSFYNYSLNQDGLVETAKPDSAADLANPNNTAIGAPITNKVLAGKEVNAGQESTRVVFEMTYNEKNPGAPLLTGALMHNIYNDTILKSRFASRAEEAVYIDAIGNIVLNDGLVVLPAAANPTYWAMPNKGTGTDKEVETWTYNPYTVAFMDTYPAIYEGGTAPSSVNMKKDKKKYLLSEFGSIGSGFVVNPLKKGFRNGFTVSRSGALYTEFKIDGTREVKDDIVVPLKNDLNVDGKESVASDSWYNVGSMHPLQMKNVISTNKESLFPYLTTEITDKTLQDSFNINTTNYKSSIYIAKNMYAYIIGEVDSKRDTITSADGRSSGGSSIGRLREGFLFNNVTMPVLTGITNGVEFDKTNAKSDLLLAGGDTGLVAGWIQNAAKALAVNSRDFSNVLAIANSDDVSLLKLIYGMSIDYGYYIVFIILFLLIILYLREADFMLATIKGGTVIGLFFVCMFVLPLLIPKITGVTADKLAHDTALVSLLTKLEMNEEVNESLQAGTSGTSVKLYNFSPKQAKEVNEQYSITDSNYLTNRFSINDNLGLYVDGTELRLDMYSFLRFDPLIVATSENVSNPNNKDGVPQIYHSDHSKSSYVVDNEEFSNDMKYNNDVLDYYMPFNLLENGFMKTLNTYLKYYDPPQSVVKYPDGLVKSSYILSSYMKSLAFLAGEPEVAKLISSAMEEDEYSHRGFTSLEVNTVNQFFYPYGDIFNLQAWVETEWDDLPKEYANSLWIQSMLRSGYYTPGSGIDKRLELADKINRTAYKIIMDLENTNGLVSDEVLIKVISMYATFEWNKTISYINHHTYPQAPSLSEISVADILNTTLLSERSTFMYYDVSLINNIHASEGYKGLFSVSVSMLMLILYSILLSWILPAMIIVLIVYSIYLIFVNERITPALIIAFKLVMIIVITNLFLTIVISMYPVYDSIHFFALFTFGVNLLMVYLFRKFIIKGGNRLENSWQNKQVRRMGFRRSSSNYYTEGNSHSSNNYYDRYGDGNVTNSRTRMESSEMREYLEESEGLNERTSRSR